MVAVARSGPVGNPPLVAWSDRVRFGVVPVQLKQKRLTSALVRFPDRLGVNVWPPHVVVVIPTPEVLSVSFF